MGDKLDRRRVSGWCPISLTRRIACSAVCVAALLALTSCGTAAPGVVSTRQVRVDAQTLFERWHGTDEQRAAAEVLVAYRENGHTAHCMRAHGFHWDWSTSKQGVTPVDALGLTFWLAQPHALVNVRDMLAVNAARRAGVRMNSPVPRPPAEEKVLTHCVNSYQGISDDDVEALRRPPSTEKLMATWVDALSSITKGFGSTQDYYRCMTKEHLSLLHGKPYGDVNFGTAIIEATPPPGKVPRPGEHPNPQWRRFVTLDTEIATADWNCRKGVYDEGIALMAPLLERFESAHKAEIRTSELGWRHVEQQAVSLGWNPDTGVVTNLAESDRADLR
jgi:hypothetical protein